MRVCLERKQRSFLASNLPPGCSRVTARHLPLSATPACSSSRPMRVFGAVRRCHDEPSSPFQSSRHASKSSDREPARAVRAPSTKRELSTQAHSSGRGCSNLDFAGALDWNAARGSCTNVRELRRSERVRFFSLLVMTGFVPEPSARPGGCSAAFHQQTRCGRVQPSGCSRHLSVRQAWIFSHGTSRYHKEQGWCGS